MALGRNNTAKFLLSMHNTSMFDLCEKGKSDSPHAQTDGFLIGGVRVKTSLYTCRLLQLNGRTVSQ